MKKILTVLFLSSMMLFAYTDMDLDGVDDSVDKCPNTPITDLVDANGCSIKSVISEQHFDIIFGVSYSDLNYRYNERTDTYTSTVQIDYYKDAFSLQLSTSYFRSDSSSYDDSGLNDTTVAAYYRFKPLPNLTINAGAGVIFPTYDAELGNNNTDYTASVNFSYAINNSNIFAGYNFTLVGDDDVDTVQYQNTNAFSVGAGYYFTPKLYASLSYYRADSIYKSVEDIENVSIYTFYSIDANWFVTANFAKGLSDSTSDDYVALRIGYYF
ncbi:porin family protein [Hydrogenimonas cancrithermarum]|uniref:DUF3187 domain-containing protein n=1 Tax=Hydrogenimonas cancrithermarum TaxID=2993563 RepID=A0ABM8FJW3_9BACT|nr:DUF3187 domain-containing protein [Hydrogenimonas cancrithermarum]BDY12597.1 hypothetical protein HCR_09090 [Hydrogenimonas cancrithermarum]